MYNFFCCCFFPELQTKTTPPITVQTIAKNISLNIIPAQDSQDRTIRTEDIVVTPPGLIDEIFDDVKEESKEESKETSKRNSFYVSPPATPPSSPAMLKRAMPVSIIQVEKMHDFLLQQVTQSVTILLHLKIQNNIITPLKRGNYQLASKKFCELFDVKPETFDVYCDKFNIFSLEDNILSYSYQHASV